MKRRKDREARQEMADVMREEADRPIEPDVPMPDGLDAPTYPEEGGMLMPGESMFDLEVAMEPQREKCLAFDLVSETALVEDRCPLDADVVIALAFVPTVMVPLCRKHGQQVVRAARERGVSAVNRGV